MKNFLLLFCLKELTNIIVEEIKLNQLDQADETAGLILDTINEMDPEFQKIKLVQGLKTTTTNFLNRKVMVFDVCMN